MPATWRPLLVLLAMAVAGACGGRGPDGPRLVPGVAIEASVAGDARLEYRVTLAAAGDTRVRLELSGNESCVDVTVVDAAGAILGGSDGGLRVLGEGGASYRDSLTVVAHGPGELRVRVEADEPIAAPARFRLLLAPLVPPSPAERQAAAAELDYLTGRGAMDGKDAAELDAARIRLDRAASTWHALGDPGREAHALVLVGATAAIRGEPAAALDAYRRALALSEAAGDRREAMRMQLRLGVVELKQGGLDDASHSFAAARDAAAALGDRDAEAFAWMDLGEVASRRDDFARAISAVDRARALFEGIDQNGLHQAHVTLGRLYRRLGDVDAALAHFDAALYLPRQPNERLGQASVLHELGVTFLDLVGDRVAGEALLERALTIRREAGAHETLAESLVTLAGARTRAGAASAGAEAAEEAVRIAGRLGSPPLEVTARLALGDAELGRGDLGAAAASYERARVGAAGLGALAQQAEALVGLGRARRRMGDAAGARAAVEAAIPLVESVRASVPDPEQRAGYFATVRHVWELEVELLAEGGDAAGALVASERARARSLLEEVEGGGGGAEGARPAPAAAVGSLAEVQALMDEDTTFVELALGDAHGFVFCVSRTGLTMGELPPRARIEAESRALLEAIAARDDASADAAARALGATLFEPVAPALGTRRLVIAADGVLEYVPFAALVVPGAPAPLVVDHELALVPSASVLAALRRDRGRRPAPRLEAAVLADPVFAADDPRVAAGADPAAAPAAAAAAGPGAAGAPSASPAAATSASTSAAELATRSADLRSVHLARLRFSRAEADALVAHVPPARRRILLDFEASRAAALADDVTTARVVHFATHGVVNGRAPALSGLVLTLVDAAGASVDGFLRASDIRRVPWRAELVVLSGCQTALGRQIAGEGLFGLTRAWIAAGTPHVVASLWRVQDKATAELMARFYAAVYEGHLPPAAALRAAMLELRADPRFASATFWAAFELHGDWR